VCVRSEQARLRARYPGTLRIERSDEGTLALTVTIPFREYLEGIAEAPASWPMAALQAQAIAARSYALATTGWDGEEGETLDTPICATTACQVYRGIPLTRSPDTARWYRAVRSTDGLVLLHQGRPAETVYFSTSNGRTYGNEDVFGSAPLPYLRPVIERDDGASPVSRWRVRLRFEDLARFLAQAGEWPLDVPITDVRLEGGTVHVSGGGESRSMTLGDFRDAVNAWAHCLAPRRYPRGGLPTTIPSRWLSLSSGPTAVTVAGRGWGHGVGMVQWGAYGKALRGLSADEILGFYYGGLRPKPFAEPGLIHVQVASGLTSLALTPSGPGARLDGEELEPGRVVVTGGEELTVRTP
jgi:stage II sporulation protein D